MLKKPRRLSTDIDIIVDPATDLDAALDAAAKIFPFVSREEQVRVGKNNIVKRHFKFVYDSPKMGRPSYILLDVLFENDHYAHKDVRKIENEILLTEEPPSEVSLPDVDSVLGDKLTAFAPHTIGILFGRDKNHVFGERYNAEIAAIRAVKVMFAAKCLMCGHAYADVLDPDLAQAEDLSLDLRSMKYLHHQDKTAWAMLVTMSRMFPAADK